jgi:hypothetical protein
MALVNLVKVNMKIIKLTLGKEVIVDDEDFKRLNKWKWHFHKPNYARRRQYFGRINGKEISRMLEMHREIMNAKEGEEIDHKNHNGLDNRKENLRRCTHSQNIANSTIWKHNTSGFRGVSLNKKLKKWVSYITLNQKFIHLGVFNNKREAALAYNIASQKYFGEFAYQNQI